MKTACLDSNVLFGVLAGRLPGTPLEQYDQLLIPSTVVGEFLCGIECDTQRGRLQKAVFDRFVAAPSVRLVAVTPVTAEQYARIFALLKRNGTPIPVNDIWIAASAMEHGSELISNDEHFSLIATLRLKRL